MKFAKYHALGNDYLVLDPKDQDPPVALHAELIRTICDRHYGIGSDGILFGPLPSAKASFSLQIYNSDGSEAEKSGNGLRIFCRYLWDRKLAGDNVFSIETKGGIVQAQILSKGKLVRVEMGTVSFRSEDIPVAGQSREVLREQIRVDGRIFQFCAATIGNPHCVILLDDLSPALAKQYGPLLEVHPLFPNRTNVQFVKVLDRNNIRIEIWERGAGYTLASGSSSCAAAAVTRKLGLCDDTVSVHMPGGRIEVSMNDAFRIVMTGPVTRVAEGNLSREIFVSEPTQPVHGEYPGSLLDP
jgi:diaminopimelate epimerase